MNQNFNKTLELKHFYNNLSLENNNDYSFFPQSSSFSSKKKKKVNILPYSLITKVIFQRSENLKSIPRIRIQAEAGSGGSSFLAPSFSRRTYTSSGVCIWQEHLLPKSQGLQRSNLPEKLFKWEVTSYLWQILSIAYLYVEPTYWNLKI